jgi:hypothetical protein
MKKMLITFVSLVAACIFAGCAFEEPAPPETEPANKSVVATTDNTTDTNSTNNNTNTGDDDDDSTNNSTATGPDGEPCGAYTLLTTAKTVRLEWTDPRGSTYVNDKVILMGDLYGCWSPAIKTLTSTGSIVFEDKLNPGHYCFNVEFDDVTAGDDGWACNDTNRWDSTKMKGYVEGTAITLSPESNNQGGCNICFDN